jgi:hypothetical protein
MILYRSILLHSSMYYNIITVLSATIIHLKSFKNVLVALKTVIIL